MMRVEYMELNKVKTWLKNPKRHKYEAIWESFQEHGYVMPLLLDERTGQLLAGHGRLESLRGLKDRKFDAPEGIMVEKGEWWVPVIRGFSSSDDPDAAGIAVADNRIEELGGWNDPALLDLLQEFGTEGTGYDQREMEEMARILAAQANPEETKGQADDIQKMIVILDRGDYEAGLKRLETLMQEHGAENHTEAFLRALEVHEKPGR